LWPRAVIRVRVEDNSLLAVTVEDGDGSVLRQCEPEELSTV
jgi:hypothetical protein